MSALKSIIYVSLIILLLLLSSCSSLIKDKDQKGLTLDSPSADRSWLTGEPCSPPCWYGLKPGITTKAEAVTILKTLPFLNASSIEDASNVQVECKDSPATYCVYLQFEEDLLVWFKVMPNYEITFAQAEKYLGKPDGVILEAFNPDGKGCVVSLLWVTRQIRLAHIEDGSQFGNARCHSIPSTNYKMLPDLLIFDVLFMTKNDIDSLTAKPTFHPWEGFIDSSR